ncbi:MAG: hypothetical protein B6U89_03890 [Desulfurococcales archaeon ex4484_58]|nr:MAG: hypothetical protein B6U89_03890 [Desulfurococcales archaeon ex4484_58]
MNSLEDLIRLASSISTPQMTTYILKFIHNDKLYLGILGVFRDYYKYYGLPVFYYYVLDKKSSEAEKIKDSNYVVVSTDGEKIEFTKNPKPGLSIPLITLAEKPAFIPEI